MTVALTNMSLIDGTGKGPETDAVLIVEGSQVVEVADTAPPDADVVDMQGLTVLPGLIDLHVHIGMNRSEPDASRYERFSEAKVGLLSLRRLWEALQGGVTTVRDVGASFGESIVLKEMVDLGVVVGPRVFAAGDSITFTGGHARYEADGVWPLRQAIRKQIREGANVIKIGQSDDFDWPGFTQEELEAICHEAHRVGKRVAVHVDIEPGYKMAVEAGVDTVEHGFYPSEKTMQLMVEQGTYWVATISVNRRHRDNEHTPDSYEQALFEAFHHRRGWSFEESKRRAALLKEAFIQFPICFERGIELGIKQVTGTDAPLAGLSMYAVRNEIVKYVQWGMEPEQALVSATSLAAEALGCDDQFGSLVPGMAADLIAVEGDPLEDIENIDNVALVMKEGLVVRDDLGLVQQPELKRSFAV